MTQKTKPTLWDCLLEHRASTRPHLKLHVFFLLRCYPLGWGVFMRNRLLEMLACPRHKAIHAPKRKKGRPNREEAAERKMHDQIRADLPVVNDQNSDLTIAMAFSLICHHWGFPTKATAEALGGAARDVLKRTDAYGLPLSGEGIRKIVQTYIRLGVVQRNFREHFQKRTLISWRPTIIRDAAANDLPMITREVLAAGGHSPHEWEDPTPII